ncbi:E7 protein [Bos taurus papillomavirus 24]|nr:E7 protein [Bos taurus papillomavirus 24]
MKGQTVTLQDVALEFQDAISPINLECDEEIETEEVDNLNPFAITATCYACENTLRLAVVTSGEGIHHLQQLLLDDLHLLCAGCSTQVFCDRRPGQNGS